MVGQLGLNLYVTATLVILSGLIFLLILISTGQDWTLARWASALAFTMMMVVAVATLVGGSMAKLSSEVTSLRLHLKNTEDDLAATKENLCSATTLDELTGCCNSKHFQNMLIQHIALSKRFDHQFCLVVLQVDQIFDVMRNHGLHSGNEILKLVGRMINGTLREVDVVGRLNTENFAVILVGTDEENAICVINRINGLISQLYMPEDPELTFTTSSGITQYFGTENATELLANATQALDLAILEGRNRVAGYLHTRRDIKHHGTYQPSAVGF